MDFSERWSTDTRFIELLGMVVSHAADDENLGITPDAYKRLPKAASEIMGVEGLDFRGVKLVNMRFGKVWMGHIFDYACMMSNDFYRTHFHDASARFADFSGSKFDKVQMTPFYAHGAEFKNCIFDNCLVFGGGASRKKYGDLNDFTGCNFANVRMRQVDCNSCNFTGANFTNGKFISCKFDFSVFNGVDLSGAIFEGCSFRGYPSRNMESGLDTQVDFRGGKIEGAVFKRCDFINAIFDDHELVRALVNEGCNLNVDTIDWR